MSERARGVLVPVGLSSQSVPLVLTRSHPQTPPSSIRPACFPCQNCNGSTSTANLFPRLPLSALAALPARMAALRRRAGTTLADKHAPSVVPCLSDHRRWSQRPPALLIASRELCNTSTHRCIPEQACSTTPRAQRLRWPDLRPLLAPCYVREPRMLVSSAKSPLQMLLPRAGCRHDHLRKRGILRPLFALGRCSPLRVVDAP